MATRNTRSRSQPPSASTERGLPASRGRGSNARGRKNVTLTRPPPSGPIEEEDAAVNALNDVTEANPHTNDGPPPPPAKKTCRRPVTRTTEGRETELPNDFPTYQNYQELRDLWPNGRCLELMHSRRHLTVSRASPEAVTELLLAKKKYEWSIHMIAMMSNISVQTAKQELKLINPSDNPTTGYDRWRAYGKLCLEHSMPNRGKSNPPLATRNAIVGAAWTSLDANEVAVFEAPLFFALAGLPDYSDFATEETNATTSKGPAVAKLNDREEALYRPIFERLVDMERVTARQGEAFDEADHRRKSLRALNKVHHTIACAADKNDWAYYFLVASAHQSSKASKLGWSKFYTSHPAAGEYVEQEADFASTFSAYVQGLSAKDRMERYSSNSKKNQEPRPQAPSDRLKIDLGNELLDMLKTTLGYKPKQGLPRGPNPQEVFKTRGIPIKLVQHPGHALPTALLSAGFNKMNCKGRELWQQDINNGLFTMEKTELEVIPRTQNHNRANKNKKVKSQEFVSDEEGKDETEDFERLDQEDDDDSSEEVED
ncbi:uncharacterized protein MELLADRAFT_92991 [Melampsora larici-populina 98AG31]|uniref:Uncharacterized protein n=1 Tax=Melampsora larici-populina (strain 98AG31 / pathotype 3-4-7) TaxID=747676 RepID=F4S3I1_MELLP|nr:uncharacterized protein MELLADRAFT_92991 [Melampsora larici-populina 98AG31]EGG00816.1 hypothetical protein MELLADRAFT_92991 [Melampsora larici-populina 98AG31]